MHFSASVTVIAAALSGVHGLVVQRDASVILGVLKNVQTDVEGLDSAVKAWTNDPAPVLDSSNKLVATISQGTSTVQASAPLSLNDSIGLLGPVKDLRAHAQTLVNDLKAKKDVVQKGGLCDAVSSQISSISDKSKGLINATVSKVPQAAQDIAKQQAQGFIDTLSDAQTAFNKDNCKNA